MRMHSKAILALGCVTLFGCPGSSIPGANNPMGGGEASSVDPNTCGNYAASDAGHKLHAFLEATVTLQGVVDSTEQEMKGACAAMAEKLGISAEGSTQDVCNAVVAEIQASLQGGLKAGAKLSVNYEPAVCTVNVEAAASASAECQGNASADVAATCSGTCSGTCEGTCDGTCKGAAGNGGAKGQCNGTCEGTCEGSCSGDCQGHASVEGDASCKASGEIKANVEAECTEPKLDIGFEAGVVVDKAKVDRAVAALKAGLPAILKLQAKVKGPVMAAFTTWAASARELAGAGMSLVSSLGDQAMCVSGQIAAAAGAIANIQASIDVQVEVSASVSTSASAEGGASGKAG